MVIAIVLGNTVGAMMATWIGMGGGLIGAFIVGLVIYAIFAILTGQNISLIMGIIFAILVYISGIITAWISSATGFGGGLVGLLLNAIVLSMLWGYFGKGKSPVELKSSK